MRKPTIYVETEELDTASQLTSTDQKKTPEEEVPLFWKIFGGSVFSIIIFLILAIFGYVINNINALQANLNTLSGEVVKKSEMEVVSTIRDRLSTVEQHSKERQFSLDKLEQKLQILDELSRELNANRERLAALEKATEKAIEQSLADRRELREQLLALREKIATLEAKMAAAEAKVPVATPPATETDQNP